jgi:hypothetical protein
MFPEFLYCARPGIGMMRPMRENHSGDRQRPLARAVDERLRAKNDARRTHGAAARWAVGVEERRGTTAVTRAPRMSRCPCLDARITHATMRGTTRGNKQPSTSLLFKL